MSGQEGSGGFLPPQAAGREPDLGAKPIAPPEPDQPDQSGAQAMDWGSAAAQRVGGDPGNGSATASMILSVSSIVLLVLTVGLATLVSLGLGIGGIICGRKGQAAVRQGVTAQNGDLAGAGFWTGVVATVLSGLATLFWLFVVALIAVDEDARREFNDSFDEQQGDPAVLIVHGLATLARSVAVLLS